jgi:hypothetical protein
MGAYVVGGLVNEKRVRAGWGIGVMRDYDTFSRLHCAEAYEEKVFLFTSIAIIEHSIQHPSWEGYLPNFC